MQRLLASALGAMFLSGCASTLSPVPIAVAELKPTAGNTASGTVSFIAQGGRILVDARVKGLTPGLHGFHIHETGNCSAPDAMSAGGHFNPMGHAHGNPAGGPHHGGDLGNLNADATGEAVLNYTLTGHSLSMKDGVPGSILGRSLIVHADPDDFKTQPTGNSGKRVACGVIALQ